MIYDSQSEFNDGSSMDPAFLQGTAIKARYLRFGRFCIDQHPFHRANRDCCQLPAPRSMRRPQRLFQLLARHHFSLLLQQHNDDLIDLAL